MATDLLFIINFFSIKVIHYIVSVTFLIFAILLIIRAIRGIVKKTEYGKIDKFLSYAFIVNLYLQLIFGLILFSNLGSGNDFNYLGANDSLKLVSKRLWPVEHIVLMLFALFIANLGLINSSKTQKSTGKFKKVLFFYMLSIVLIAFSLFSIYV